MRKILLTLFAVFTANVAFGQTNLLTNGSFEEWTDGVPTGWMIAKSGENTAGSNVAVAQSTDAQAGTYAAALTNSTAGNSKPSNGRIASSEIKLKAGTYTYTIYVKAADETGAAARIGYVPIDATTGKVGSYAYGNNENGFSAPDTLTTTWLKKTQEFTLKETTTICLLVMHSKNYADKTVIIDNASLTTTDGGISDGTDEEEEEDVTEYEEISVADFIAKEDTETNYKLTGIVTGIYNTTYGNFYLADLDNNDTKINVYGVVDSEGTKKIWNSLGIAEKDTITIIGKFVWYNDAPEIANAIYVSHKTYTGEKVSIENTPETAYTVAKVKELVDAGEGLSDEVYVKGIISEIKSVTAGGSATYYIVDNVGDEFSVQIYKGNYLENHAFDTANDIKVGDEVIVYGLITLYGSTYEVNSGNYIYSLNGETKYQEKEQKDISNTPETAYTVSQAVALIDAGEGLAYEVYVKGIVSEIKSLDTSKYQRAQYYISEDGTTDGQLYVYNGYYLNGADFTSDDQLNVGDQVIVLGKLTKYNTTYEIDVNNQLYSINGVTPVQGIAAQTEKAQVIYNLAGQRVEKAVKGIYIINGKKVLK